MSKIHNETMKFRLSKDLTSTPKEILETVLQSLKEKGYDPVNQIVGYFLSGDPTYITSHKNARTMISRIERDELLEELVRSYIKNMD